MARVVVSTNDFDAGAEILALLASSAGVGGLASFIGVVRSDVASPIEAMTLEHYPGMTERALGAIAAKAETRFGLLGCVVIHRVGRLLAGEQIVLVLTAAGHRGAALEGCSFLIDWLKTAAPFWKQEHFADGKSRWVEARCEDDEAALRWLGA